MNLTYFTPEDLLARFHQEVNCHTKEHIPCPLTLNQKENSHCDCFPTKVRLGKQEHVCRTDEPCIVRVLLSKKESLSVYS